MYCELFAAGECTSCSLIETPYPVQLANKEASCRTTLGTHAKHATWLKTYTAGQQNFRNRAKFVVGGSTANLTLGIPGPRKTGVDLTACPIQSPGVNQAGVKLTEFLNATRLAPYDVTRRQGELKFVHVTESPDGELLIRFVVRSEHAGNVIEAHSSALHRSIPNARTVTVNILPEHKAVLEGDVEWALWGTDLPMRLGDVNLRLLPRSFFQTNTGVARELYRQVAHWVDEVSPASLWDLYCGVGGFALHCTAVHREMLGVEASEAAVRSARQSADAMRASGNSAAKFIAQDATEFAVTSREELRPDMLIVNPPRRGIGHKLSEWIENSHLPHVVYSSCNPITLAQDLDKMPSFSARQVRVFDMFPHTRHVEVVVLLERTA